MSTTTLASPDPDDSRATPKMTADTAKALADKVIEDSVLPKKIPPVDDIDAQTKAVGGALANALLMATEIPLTMLQEVVGDLAHQLVAYGIRQTEHIDLEAANAPGWVLDGVRQQSVKLPEPPSHTESEPAVARTAEAPTPPKKFAKHHHRAAKL